MDRHRSGGGELVPASGSPTGVHSGFPDGAYRDRVEVPGRTTSRLGTGPPLIVAFIIRHQASGASRQERGEGLAIAARPVDVSSMRGRRRQSSARTTTAFLLGTRRGNAPARPPARRRERRSIDATATAPGPPPLLRAAPPRPGM